VDEARQERPIARENGERLCPGTDRAKWPPTTWRRNRCLETRALFFIAYDSFDAWEKDMKSAEKDRALTAELDRANVADGDLLSDVDQAVMSFAKT